jgi:UDP-glucuronate decarboxylase
VKTVLIAGGAGFLGSHLCRAVLPGNRLICLDNLSTGRRENIADLTANPAFSFIESDITKPLKLDGPVDEIYNMAGPASPAAYAEHPVATLRACSEGFYNVLELAAAKGARVLQSSTSEVYGNPGEHPQKETYFGNVNPVGERSCYDEGKRFAESMAINFGRTRGVPVAIARIFNTYGPGMRPDDGRVVPSFINQAMAGWDMTIFGDGHNTRSFCYVHDMINGLVRLMASDERGPINLGNPVEITIKELAEKILKIASGRSKIVFLPPAADDPIRRCPDISLAREKLGWNPHVGLDEGLAETIEWVAGVYRRKV